MARARVTSSSSTALAIFLLFMTLVGQSYAQLEQGFYAGKCKGSSVEQVIFGIVRAAFQTDRTIVAALLRMQFHDCFVRGCDASLLLDGSNSEKVAAANGSVRGYELIDACKEVLEQQCPGVVSCADIIVIATRVSVFLARGRWYNVETGRRDGVVSSADEARANLPGPSIPVADAIDVFRSKGLSDDDFLLLLGGGHTVGIIQCRFLLNRLYDFQGTGEADPTINPTTLTFFRETCPRSGSTNFVFADQTVGSEFTVDRGFYQAIRQGKGTLQIDQQIALDPLTSETVRRLAETPDFAIKFGDAMVRLGRVGVLTGSQGQIRTNCRHAN